MNGNIDMAKHEIINLLPPTSDTDAATLKYVKDDKAGLSNYLKQDGTKKMTGDLNTDDKRIKNLNSDEPVRGTDAVNQNFVNSANLSLSC